MLAPLFSRWHLRVVFRHVQQRLEPAICGSVSIRLRCSSIKPKGIRCTRRHALTELGRIGCSHGDTLTSLTSTYSFALVLHRDLNVFAFE